MFRHRPGLFLSFLSALLVANVSGPQYVYPIYSTFLQDRFQWSSLEHSIVNTACFVGVSFSGPLCSWAMTYFGTKTTLRIASAIIFSGFFLIAQTYAGYLPQHFMLITFYLGCTGIAGAASFLCALDSQSHHFKQYRGLSMGLTTASIGISGLVFSQINDFFFKTDMHQIGATYRFLLFLAACTSLVILSGSFLFLEPVQDPLGHPPVTTRKEEQRSGLAFLLHPTGTALFSALFVILGMGYMYLANLGHILMATSLSSQHERNHQITLFSLGNCLSRAFFGALTDLMWHRWGLDPLWIFCLALLALPQAHQLPPTGSTLLISITYGIGFGVSPSIVTGFGTEAFAKNWGWMLFAPALGSQFFNVLYGAYDVFRVGQWFCWAVLGVVLYAVYRNRKR